MNNIYLSPEEITNYENSFKSILKPDFIKDCKSYAKRLDIKLTGSPQSNKQLAFEAIKKEVETLPANHKFHNYFKNDFNAAHQRYVPNGNILAYRDFAGLSEGYNLLCSPIWRELDLLQHNLSLRGFALESFIQSLIDSNGDYRQYLNGFSKKHCNPSALASTEKLQNTLESIFKDKNLAERYKIGLATQQYANKQDMSFHELHEALNNK